MHWRSLLTAALALPFAVDPCFGMQPQRRKDGDLAIQARSILRTYCVECHGVDHASSPARTGFSVLNRNSLVNPDPARAGFAFIDLKGKSPSHLLHLIDSGTMPPGGRDRPSDAQLGVLRQWVAAGAPSYPEAFDEATTLRVMLDDFATRNEVDKPYIRYLSFAHLIVDDQPLPDIWAKESDLARVLVDTTRDPEGGGGYAPEPVDATATLFRIDLRRLGWSHRDLFVKDEPDRGSATTLTPYDVILLDYPHGFALGKQDPLATQLDEYLAITKSIRPVPFLRGDWLIKAIDADKNEPLGADLVALMELSKAIDKKVSKLPVGPKQTPFANSTSLLLPAPRLGRPILPIGAAYALDVATNPPPFKFNAAVVRALGEPIKQIKINEPFPIEVESDRDVHLLLLNVLPSGDFRILTFRGGPLLNGGKPRLLFPEMRGGFEIPSIDGGKDEATEHFILIASENPIPAESMSIVRSRHLDYNFTSTRGPIWRLVFTPKPGTIDETKIIRKVLPLKVTRK